jgi:hypothetical protein
VPKVDGCKAARGVVMAVKPRKKRVYTAAIGAGLRAEGAVKPHWWPLCGAWLFFFFFFSPEKYRVAVVYCKPLPHNDLQKYLPQNTYHAPC